MKGARELATRAAREAARVRMRLGIGPTSSLCPLDIADALGIVVRLDALPSLEGMYAPGDRDTVLLGAERPWGRVRHTCGHELGHHVFQHGTCVDELCVGRQPTWEPEEYLADRFSTALTMPKLAVGDALRRRGWNPATLTAEQAFLLAQDFGVGYRNFVSHAERSLRMLSPSAADSLRRQGRQLGRLRTAVAGFRGRARRLRRRRALGRTTDGYRNGRHRGRTEQCAVRRAVRAFLARAEDSPSGGRLRRWTAEVAYAARADPCACWTPRIHRTGALPASGGTPR